MSRIGKQIIKLTGVTATTQGNLVTVTGPKGTLKFELTPAIGIDIANGEIAVKVLKESKEASALMGMTRSILNNMVKGVAEGFEKKLELVGVGYRAKMNGPKVLSLSVGFSHTVEFPVPEGITIEVVESAIIIKGIDKHMVGQVAANIRKIRKPEPYKGKGIRYSGEVVRRKQGKSGKV